MDTEYSIYTSDIKVSTMINAQRAIFPGILFASIFIIFVTQIVANPQIVLASTVAEIAPVSTPVSSFINDGAPREQADSEQNAVILAPSQPDSCSLSDSVPGSVRQWCDLIDRYSNEVGLPPKLIAALITQESAGNSSAYSHSGAVGLMQVMPRDGIATKFMCKNGPCFHDRPSMTELYDPEFNIRWGTQFLADLQRRHGNIRDALKSYGPMDRGYQYADLVLSIYERY
jgi:soluble lytic murein transglycosylase-like protein